MKWIGLLVFLGGVGLACLIAYRLVIFCYGKFTRAGQEDVDETRVAEA